MKKYTCGVCGYVYDPAQGDPDSGVAPGTPFEKLPDNFHQFTTSLDEKLKSLNSDYEAKRYHDKVLSQPIIRIMREHTFYNWLKSKDKLGGQHKVPRLSNERRFVEDILIITKSH